MAPPIGKRIAQARKAAGWTQAQLSQRTHFSVRPSTAPSGVTTGCSAGATPVSCQRQAKTDQLAAREN